MKTAIIATLACVILVSGCGGPKPQLQPVVPAAPASPQISLPEKPSYVLGVGDKIEIRFPYYGDYNVDLMVRPDGRVTIPFMGEIDVEGMAPSELQNRVRARYAEMMTEPEVSVVVTETAGQIFFVFGEVNIPGSFGFKGSMTVLDAIASAGGLTHTGRKDSIVLIRQSQNGKFSGIKINLDDIIDGRGENIPLMARDVVYVPMSVIGKVDLFVQQFATGLTPAWYFYIYGRESINPGGRFIFGQ